MQPSPMRIPSSAPERLCLGDQLRSAPARYLKLSCGRRLCWTEFGDASGIPVLYFHSRGSSRLEAAFFSAEAQSRGFRLIAVDRPGIGGSDFSYARTPDAFCADLYQLIEHLKLDTLATLSLGAGAVYSLALAAQVGDRMTAQVCLGSIPVGPLWGAEAGGRLTRRRVLLAKAMRYAARLRARLETGLCSSPPGLVDLCSSDRRALADSKIAELLSADGEEARKQGVAGIAQDDSIAMMPFDCDLASIRCAVTFWQGASDPTCLGRTPALLSQRLRYGRERAQPRQGQFFFLSVMAEIFQQINTASIPPRKGMQVPSVHAAPGDRGLAPAA